MRRLAHSSLFRATLLAGLAAGQAGCGGGAAPAWDGPPVLVVGIDGLDWGVLEPLMAQGRAPHFRALVERGIGGALQTMMPTFSPVLWTTMATGRPPQEHGILSFSVPLEVAEEQDGKTVRRKVDMPYTSNSRALPAIWNMAGEHGRSVLGVGWWVSWPAEPVPNGRIVASYAAQVQGQLLWKSGVWEKGLPEHTWPPALAGAIAPALADGGDRGPLSGEYVATFGKIRPGPQREFRKHMAGLFHVAYRGDATHVRIMVEQLRQEVADLNLVYIGLPDVAGHYYWRYREPQLYRHPPAPEIVAALKDHVDKTYERADAWLGQLVAAVPEDTRILVLSDHGMHAFNLDKPEDIAQGGLQSGGHEDGPDGVFIVAGPGIERRGLLPAAQRRIAHLLDVAPTLLDWLELEQAEGAPGRALRELLTPTWRDAHPERGRFDYAAGFRPPTPPREPYAGASADFMKDLVGGLGYIDVLD